jgi:hypothetical protein
MSIIVETSLNGDIIPFFYICNVTSSPDSSDHATTQEFAPEVMRRGRKTAMLCNNNILPLTDVLKLTIG